MKHNKIASIITMALALPIVGCGKPMPKCDDEKVVAAVRMITDNVIDSALKQTQPQVKEMLKVEHLGVEILGKTENFALSAFTTTNTNKENGLVVCRASMSGKYLTQVNVTVNENNRNELIEANTLTMFVKGGFFSYDKSNMPSDKRTKTNPNSLLDVDALKAIGIVMSISELGNVSITDNGVSADDYGDLPDFISYSARYTDDGKQVIVDVNRNDILSN